MSTMVMYRLIQLSLVYTNINTPFCHVENETTVVIYNINCGNKYNNNENNLLMMRIQFMEMFKIWEVNCR